MDKWSPDRGRVAGVWPCPHCLESLAAGDANVSCFFIELSYSHIMSFSFKHVVS